ncbi:Asp23/Gls24 family envelope stress response protein [Paenibacillus sp. GCM10012306]|uniref:Asp23/Gls24 family envelope stress response protein n=1 Tax=Paenibacillus sp. GCM10012306 TaxID=3317342 RepID=UPI00361131A6
MLKEFKEGFVHISDTVVTKIVGLATIETPGIASMSKTISEGLTKRLSGKGGQEGITIEVKEREVEVDLRIVVSYGYKIHEVCQTVQQNVRDAVETMMGLSLVSVNVRVEGIAIS